MKPHKHAELIKAWADGAEIEARYLKASGWTDWRLEDGGFIWYVGGAEYRIKPEPLVKYEYLMRLGTVNSKTFFVVYEKNEEDMIPQIKLTYIDEVLVNAEVIK